MQTDKRVLKTRASIKAAFMELVKTDDMAKMSVSALAAKALVNRSTFYLHYNDVGDVVYRVGYIRLHPCAFQAAYKAARRKAVDERIHFLF